MSREDCWINETYFLTPSGVLQPVEAIRAGDQVCAANGQVLQIKKAERLPRENRNLVHMKTEYAELVVTSNHKVMAERGRQIQPVMADKLSEGHRVLISGSRPQELTHVRHFNDEVECYRLELDPDLPIESFHKLKGILTKGQGQQPHRRAQRTKQSTGLPLERLPEDQETPLD